MQQADPERDLKGFFLQEKPSEMIVILGRKGSSYSSELSSMADTTYSHAVKVMKRMGEAGLVKSSRNGRKKEYSLTPTGRKIADNLERLFDEVDGIETSIAAGVGQKTGGTLQREI